MSKVKMMSFKEYLFFDKHNHTTFERSYNCYRSFVELQCGQGVDPLQQKALNHTNCQKEYLDMQTEKVTNNACVSACAILNAAITRISENVIKELSNGSKVDRSRSPDGKSQDGITETFIGMTSPHSRKRQKDNIDSEDQLSA